MLFVDLCDPFLVVLLFGSDKDDVSFFCDLVRCLLVLVLVIVFALFGEIRVHAWYSGHSFSN